MNTADLRREYHRATLNETGVDASPVVQFERWLAEAVKAEVPEPTAMTLATVGEGGRPAARIVLLKGVGAEGFLFFTNYDSREGQGARRPTVRRAPVPLGRTGATGARRRQGVEGLGRRLGRLFRFPPAASRIGAWASRAKRSDPGPRLAGAEFSAVQERYAADPDSIPRPQTGADIACCRQRSSFGKAGGPGCTTRIRYRLEAAHWRIERLAP